MNGHRRYEGLNNTLKIFVGPMSAAKTSALLIDLHQRDLSKDSVILPVKSAKDPRPPKYAIGSRIEGLSRPALIVPKLGELATALAKSRRKAFRDMRFKDVTWVGIDELMFFDDAEDTYTAIKQLLRMGKKVVASSLDIAGNGQQFPVITKMAELKADFEPKKTTCANCNLEDSAVHTCIYENGSPNARPFIRETLDFYVPDDGSLAYRALCRACYDYEGERPDAVEFTEEIAARLKSKA